MNETDWAACADPNEMYDFLRELEEFSERKVRLLDCACVRRIWHLLSDPVGQGAVVVAERFADGLTDHEELREAQANVLRHANYAALYPTQNEPISYSALAAAAATAWEFRDGASPLTHAADAFAWEGRSAIVSRSERREIENRRLAELNYQARLIREIFGNPFRPVAFDPRWRTSDTVGLAQAIYDDRAFERLPILADALMDAGCEDEQVISHCRSEGPHVRGCWVVDLVLGKE